MAPQRQTRPRTLPAAALPAAVLLALGAAMPGAHAQTWAKTGSPGNLPGNAQVTVGNGPLTTILGSFTTTSTASTASIPDLYKIAITGLSPFSVTTASLNTTVYDTQLFLFDGSGQAVYFNDDTSDFTKQATIAPSVPLTPGFYFLGISAYGAVPRAAPPAGTATSAAFDLFNNPIDDTTGAVGFTGLQGPKAGVSGPLAFWSLSGADVETGSYTISMTGANYAVPEASTLVSFGLPALLGLALIARRRRKAAPTA